jgi:hypothetical protein
VVDAGAIIHAEGARVQLHEKLRERRMGPRRLPWRP